jgi:crotonobetainyl-CoA:carnitine CoA-transferase CaiB-like acyl-CoA transferase
MTNWGLNYERLREIKQDIIMVSMSGMGQSGPWKNYVAFGPTIQSLAGLTFLTSDNKDSPAGPGYSYADVVAGLYGALAVLAALEYRNSTGLGCFIDLSEYEAACTLLGPFFLDQIINQRDILPQGNSSPYVTSAPHGCYPCLGKDRWCVIAVFKDDEWKALRDIMGDPSWAKDDNFSTSTGRKRYEAELDRYIQEWTIQYRAENIVQRLQEANIPSGVVQNAEDLAQDPQLLARRYFREINNSVSGNIRTDRCPIRFGSKEEEAWKPSSMLGEDNQYVYHELLGFSEEVIKSHTENGIIE